MEQEGHGGFSFGVTSLGSVLWMRHRLANRLDYLSDLEKSQVPPVADRVKRRAPLSLAAATVIGTATVFSRNLDQIERELFGHSGHRKNGHSLIYGMYGHDLTKRVVDTFRRRANNLCETYGVDDSRMVQSTIRATADLVGYIADGAFVGQLTHLLGDLPTSGNPGVTALQILAPLCDHDFSLDLITSCSPSWNQRFRKVGLAIGAGALGAIGVYTVTPTWPGAMVKNAIQNAWKQSRHGTFEDIAPLVLALPRRIATSI